MSEKQINKAPLESAQSTLAGVVCTEPGSHIAPVYKRVFNTELNRNVVTKVDETDIFEFIQASKSTNDLAILQQRFIALGEIPCVDPTLGSNDLTQFPSDIHGVYDMVNSVDKNFKMLPDSIQAIFGTSQAYMEALLNGTYQATILNAINNGQASTKEVKEEVVTNE